MSKGLINKVFDKETTRREFLKLTGKGVAGFAVTSSILSMFGFGEEAMAATALPEGLLVVDRSKCTGCQRCEITCTLQNDGKVQPFLSRIKVGENYNFGTIGPKINYQYEDGQMGNLKMSPVTCKQCREPFCANACPNGAIVADARTGARVVLKDKCVGCGVCTEACPWNLPTIDTENGYATKCTTCGSCVRGCPTDALKVIKWEDISKAHFFSKR
ncbi:ferredoxin-like protein [Cetobacterium somerae]|uniref:ferredoxin-like protein n=1 Tax=Cetobacterium somerae TaxID=188913 RepID=UPI0038921A63